ncbi:MAG TPA: hypothetical protein VFI41_05350 [Gemmatimonadales bacterium]|nr:hypothetical protein [Gemmatimonadales bacterium]
MGRQEHFNAGAYGDFEPTEDINLSDKVSDHPFYGQSGPFHEPDQPTSPTCLQCGRGRNEHKSIHLPPTREGYAAMQQMVEGAKTQRRQGKEKEALESDQEGMAKGSPYGTKPHFVRGRGYIEKGPSSNKELRQHLVDDHDLWEEDAADIEHPARSHARWHAQNEFGGETHDHTFVHPHDPHARP